MAVWVKQTDDGVVTDGPRQIFGEGSDGELLRRKYEGAMNREWLTNWQGHSFVARKVRGADPRNCERTFWIE
jgi:hypothetical protein